MHERAGWFRDRLKEQAKTEAFQKEESVCFKINPLFLYRFLFFIYDPLTTSFIRLRRVYPLLA
jgi:hypothetical protein